MGSPKIDYCVRVFLIFIPCLIWLIVQQGDRHLKNITGNRAKRALTPRVALTSVITLFGVSVETDPEIGGAIEFGTDGSVTLLEGTTVNLMVFGHFTNSTRIRLAMHEFSCDVDTDMIDPPAYDIQLDEQENKQYGLVAGRVSRVTLPKRSDYPRLYFCLSEDEENWFPQGNSMGTHFYLTTSFLPLWVRVLFVIFLLGLSGLFSGLSLGLMSLDKTDLSILSTTGTDAERKYAGKIAPVRNHGNFLLCSLLFSNVLVNASLTLMMDSLMSGAFAVASATLAIVIFGEIIPQSVCSRFGLAVGAHTLFLTKFFMVLTAPLAWPMSKILDKVLGEEIGAVYTRERLKELLVVTEGHHGLEKEELTLISGALGMKSKTVADVMTPLSSVFMVSIDSDLDYNTLAEIEFQAYTRVPIFSGKDHRNIVAILNLKQISPLDAGENIPFQKIVDYYPSSKDVVCVSKDASLTHALRKFRLGGKCQMMVVQGKNSSNEGSPKDETEVTVGIITMEDVLEELLQTNILDEKDIEKLMARKGKISVTAAPNLTRQREFKAIKIPPPLALAAMSHLTANIPAFSRSEISGTVLNRLIKVTLKRTLPSPVASPHDLLLEAGRPADAFIMILEGRVEVLAGKEMIPFSCGPFMCFGTEFLFAGEIPKESLQRNLVPKADSAGKGFQRISTHFKRRQTPQLRRMSTVLSKPLPKPPKAFPKYSFIPDYSVRVVEETFYAEIDFRIYRAARAATQLEKTHKSIPGGLMYRTEWRKEVEETLTVIESDLKHKHRGRIISTEAEKLEKEDIDMDVQLTTGLFLGSAGEEIEAELETSVIRKPSKWQKIRLASISTAPHATQGTGGGPSRISLPAAVIELLRDRRART